MSKPWRRGKAQPPFEEWDGSKAAFQARTSYAGPDRRAAPTSSASSREIDRLIEAAVRENAANPRARTRPPALPARQPLPAETLEQIKTLADLWTIWELSPAPRERAAPEDG